MKQERRVKAMAKKRANGDGSIRQRKDKTWEGRITIGTDLGSGKPIRKSVYGHSKAEVAEKLRAITSQVDAGSYFEPENITLKKWFETWISDFGSDKKPLTIRQYESMANTHIYPALGAVKLSNLTSIQLQKFYNQLAVDGKTLKRKNSKTGETETIKEPLSAKTIRNIHDIISKALNTAVKQGLIKENVAVRTTLPKVIKKEVTPLSEDMQKRFLKEIQNNRFKNIFTVTLFTGVREGEIVGATWDCLDWTNGTLKIYRQLQRNPDNWSEWRFAPLKNNKVRYIKLSPYVIGILKNQQAKQLQERFNSGDLWQGFQSAKESETWFIFTDELGNPLKSSTVYENFKKVAESIGIPSARFHDLRHTYAVNSLASGDDPKTVQENLGHATASFTLDVYGHVSDRMKSESARRQQELIERMGISGL